MQLGMIGLGRMGKHGAAPYQRWPSVWCSTGRKSGQRTGTRQGGRLFLSAGLCKEASETLRFG
jgi:hypothetical protein